MVELLLPYRRSHIQLRLLLRTPAADHADRQAGGAVRHTPQERRRAATQVYRSLSVEARPSRARIERSGDVALTARMLWTGGSVVAGVILPDERRPRRQGRGVSIRFLRAQAFKVPGSTIHVAQGSDEDRKGLAMVLCGLRRRRPAGWGAELVAVAVPRQDIAQAAAGSDARGACRPCPQGAQQSRAWVY
jgi:hypothetical protein